VTDRLSDVDFGVDSLLDTAPCGFIAFADDGTIRAANATLCDLLGYVRDELQGRRLESILNLGSRIFYQTHFFPLIRLQGSAEEIFLLLRSKNGDDVATLCNAVRRQRAGEWITDCVFMRVYERQKFEDALLRAKNAAEEANEQLERQAMELEMSEQQLLEQGEELLLEVLVVVEAPEPARGLELGEREAARRAGARLGDRGLLRLRGGGRLLLFAGAPRAERGVGGGVFAAFVQVARSPYLLGIVAFVVLMTWVSTFLYLEQQAFVAKVFHSTDERARFFAGIDFWVQAASLTIQFLLFGRLFKWFGMRSLLAAVPLLMTAGYAVFALAPTFMVLVLVYAVRRVADYAITRPCRDSLFTVVSREEKYQAKSLIDTFAYRGGDAVSGSLYKALTGGLGASPAAIGWLGAVIAALWTVLALALGRAFQRRGSAVRTEA